MWEVNSKSGGHNGIKTQSPQSQLILATDQIQSICVCFTEISHEVAEEKNQINFKCAHRVKGKVKWSRKSGGTKNYILTATGSGDIRHDDPYKRYSSLADKSLSIISAKISDSGLYYCDGVPAVELTVITQGNILRFNGHIVEDVLQNVSLLLSL